MAGTTGLEPATSDVTGRRSNQLNYDSAKSNADFQLLIANSVTLSGSRKVRQSEIGNRQCFGGRGGTRTPNLFLVREAVYH